MERSYPTFTVTEKAEHSIRLGHPWVYDSEILAGECENGRLANVTSRKGRWLGAGFYNGNSKIRLRIISRNANDDFSEAFFERRLRHAVDYRRTVMGPDFACCRLIFGEADLFPGLTVDRFGSILVAQTLSLGIERIKPMLFRLLVKILREYGEPVEAIYERNDVKIRELEGMEQGKGFFPGEGLAGDLPGVTEICENGIYYSVDYVNGQKTGFFLDQKYNRLAIQRFCRGRRVLDCFTHTGSFALNAGIAGAASVLGVDASELGVEQARKNAELNGLSDRVQFVCADVFDLLPQFEQQGEQFDVVILDPPAFTKSRSSIKNAVKGYREINLRGMKLVKDGGYLATCSCSHFMDPDLFAKTIREAAAGAHKRLRQVEYRTQAADHPILWMGGEQASYYLKFYIFQVCEEQ